MGIEGNKAARDVEKLDNIACLTLPSAEGPHFTVRQPCTEGPWGHHQSNLADHCHRGPAIGFKRKRQVSTATEHIREAYSSTSPPLPTSTRALPVPVNPTTTYPAQTASPSPSRMPSPESSLPPSRLGSKSSLGRDAPLLGLPRPMVDELLAAYFTHVHVSIEHFR
jgi:hypothetical protein